MTTARCPACGASLPGTASRGGEIRCPGCGKELRIRVKAAEPAPRSGKESPLAAATEGDVARPPSPAPEPRRKRKRKAKKGLLAGRTRLVAAAAGAALAVLLVIVTVVLLSRGSRGGTPDAGAGGKGEDQGANLVVFDTALPAEKAPAAAPPPAIIPAPPPDPAKPLPSPAKPAKEDGASEPAPAKALWSIPTDPRPTAPPVRYASDLRVPLVTARVATHYLLKYLPVTADLDGPFALFFPAFDKTAPAKPGRPAPGDGSPPAPLVDLRTGQQAGTFAATSPYWRDARLSPDGLYLVGPDSGPKSLLDPERNALFVWKRGADTPARKLPVPGAVDWLGFVAPDRLAVHTFDPKPALQIWDVAAGKVLRTVRLTADPLPPPGAGFTVPQRDLHTFYRPWPLMAAVSPGGRYVALGTRSGVTLVDAAEGKEIGTLPIPGLSGAEVDAFRGLSFRPDGTELFALVAAARVHDLTLRSWSVTDGRPRMEVKLQWAAGHGPPLPGPEPGTVVLPGGNAGALARYGYIYPFRATDVRPAAVVETRAGSVLERMGYCVLRWAEDGPLVVAGGPREGKPPAKPRPDEKWDKGGVPQEVYTVTLDRARLIAAARQRAAGLAARPPVVRADRTAVKALTPEPPAAWAAPPAVPKVEPTKLAWLEFNFPAAFGDTQAAVLRFEYQRDVRERFELHWDRHDWRTGARIGSAMLWPWARDPARLKEKDSVLRSRTPPAALTADGNRLAVCDPADLSRVDMWAADGKRLLGFHPAGAGRAVAWLGWSPAGRLLTVADGRLTAWEIPGARAVFEVSGGYTGPAALAPGRAWLAVASGDHIDLLDSATGACLGRCRAGGVTEAVRDLALSGDGKRLAVVFPGPGDKANKFTAQLWDLTTGKAQLLHFGSDPYATVGWVGPEHLATFASGNVLYDVSVRQMVAWYHFPPAEPRWNGPMVVRSPDGRLWVRRMNNRPGRPTDNRPGRSKRAGRVAGVWWALPEADLLVGLGAGPREYVAGRPFPVRVEADLGSAERSQGFARQVAEMLRKDGFAIGPKGWCLRVTHQVVNTSKELTHTGLINVPEFIPAVRFQWRLLDAEGNTVWERQSSGRFAYEHSKYYTGTTREKIQGRRDLEWVKAHFNFGGRPMRDAIADEILDTQAQRPTPLGPLPAAWLRVGREYRQMPVQISPVKDWPEAGGP